MNSVLSDALSAGPLTRKLTAGRPSPTQTGTLDGSLDGGMSARRRTAEQASQSQVGTLDGSLDSAPISRKAAGAGRLRFQQANASAAADETDDADDTGAQWPATPAG